MLLAGLLADLHAAADNGATRHGHGSGDDAAVDAAGNLQIALGMELALQRGAGRQLSGGGLHGSRCGHGCGLGGLGGLLAGLGVLRPGTDAEQLVCGLLDDLAVHDAVPLLLIQWFDSDRWPAAVFCGSP